MVCPTTQSAFFYLSSAALMMIAQASVLQKDAKSLVFSGELSHVFAGPTVVVFFKSTTCPEIRLQSKRYICPVFCHLGLLLEISEA